MSKKKKVSSAKKTKVVTKKVKKVAKPAPKKKAKPAVKNIKKKSIPAKSKKPVKKEIKKVVKKAVKKPAVKAKPVAKKKVTVKPVKKVVSAKKVKSSVKVKVAAKPAKSVNTKPNKPLVVSTPVKQVAKSFPKTPEKVVNKVELKSSIEDKKTEVMAIVNTIPKIEVSELPLSKIASITSSITNPIKNQGAYAVKVEKEPNGKFEMEFVVKSSPELLYEFFSTASGLSEWFCDDVNIRNGIYTFIWDEQMQQARLLKTLDNQLARFQWVDKTDGSYFEFRVQKDDLTNDIALIVTDFAESKADQESAKLLWNSQIEKLMHVIGSIF